MPHAPAPPSASPSHSAPRWPLAAGALLAAISIALAAYASHGVGGAVQARLQLAAVFGFGHGVALAALAPLAVRGFARWALPGMLAGVLLFSGSLVASHWLGTPTTLAPFGGSLMILAWLLLAIGAMRR
ncbi:MAG TPA: DUF423 domain-containing protein [Paracoccaceae bacterium]|nr:DUF423 domain-containing protein [Paracoccaceae bacterium]